MMTETKRVKMGRLFVVFNKNKHMMANKSYIFTYLEGRDGPVAHMFTDAQLKEARERAIKNTEDCLPITKWWKFW